MGATVPLSDQFQQWEFILLKISITGLSSQSWRAHSRFLLPNPLTLWKKKVPGFLILEIVRFLELATNNLCGLTTLKKTHNFLGPMLMLLLLQYFYVANGGGTGGESKIPSHPKQHVIPGNRIQTVFLTVLWKYCFIGIFFFSFLMTAILTKSAEEVVGDPKY